MTYNVRSMRDDRAALGRVLRAAAPDIVLVQEAPRFLRWRARSAQLARLGGLVVVGGGRAAGANLVLSSLGVDVDDVRDVLFSNDRGLHRRGTAIGVLRKGGSRFGVAGIHLDLDEAARWRHVGELEQVLDATVPADVPAIVAGDVNDLPRSRVWHRLAASRRDAFAEAGAGDRHTYPAADSHKVIDGIFVDERIAVLRVEVLDSPDVRAASDHRPVVADLRLP